MNTWIAQQKFPKYHTSKSLSIESASPSQASSSRKFPRGFFSASLSASSPFLVQKKSLLRIGKTQARRNPPPRRWLSKNDTKDLWGLVYLKSTGCLQSIHSATKEEGLFWLWDGGHGGNLNNTEVMQSLSPHCGLLLFTQIHKVIFIIPKEKKE